MTHCSHSSLTSPHLISCNLLPNIRWNISSLPMAHSSMPWPVAYHRRSWPLLKLNLTEWRTWESWAGHPVPFAHGSKNFWWLASVWGLQAPQWCHSAGQVSSAQYSGFFGSSCRHERNRPHPWLPPDSGGSWRQPENCDHCTILFIWISEWCHLA